ncbi:amidohydrolase [Novacetimonas cocois]|uniref:Amidohydrolase n=2 Tax=Novacetimonas cocois TaxID=1747507 RepID=A0A365YX74_9PROT|nr:amidohydrolase [Novacetimonas cocois]
MHANTDRLWDLVEAHAPQAIALSDAVWAVPELNFAETRSCALHDRALRDAGFHVTPGIASLPTALLGEAGRDGPTIAFLGEYDALPGLSQQAGATTHRPLPGDGNGHGCGHNLLGAASLLAATALKAWLAETGLPGRVRYYGCPAEEGGAGKAIMVRAGVFAGADAAITWHPGSFAMVLPPVSLASLRVDFIFAGRSAHAAAAPHLGRSALDAAELMNIGVNYLREHMPPAARVHYAYLDAGGSAPNVVPARTTVAYSLRAPNLAEMHALAGRVRRIAEGAAMMTETTMTCAVVSSMANLLGNRPLEEAMQAQFERLGPPPFTTADRAFATAMRATLDTQQIATVFRALNLPVRPDMAVCDTVIAHVPERGRAMMGSTDVGDVSWVVPTVQALGATSAVGTPLHSWQMTAQGCSALAHTGMVHVAKVMAATGAELIRNAALLERVRATHARQIARHPHISPMPSGLP